MSTETDVHDALASHSDEYEVRGLLHEVPPHATYEVALDGQRAVCKLATSDEGDPATEARLLQHVDRTTSIPVPHVLAVGDDHFVAAWSDDVPEDPCDVDESRARTIGAGLARLHEETAFDAPGFFRSTDEGVASNDGRVTDGPALDARESWPATVRAFLEDRRACLADHERGRTYVDAADDALALLRERPELLDGAGDPVLCHGNYLPEHVGVYDGDVTCVIDFEHALAGPAEYDYWRTALPLLGNEDEAVEAAFRAGYESVRPLPDGFDEREEVYRLVNTASYVRSLFLQGNVTGEEAERRADRMTEYVRKTVDALRDGAP
ncbi:phosphotransferase family protein [Halomicrococcus gelatinilyticus]|uniref:phosphotransferase family protein n=1 Tax=Halomicrococcus gelatinilyticus TaxID=1702103 RepID=UPI002E140FCA